MDYIIEILKSPLLQALNIGVILLILIPIIWIANKFGIPILPFLKKKFGLNGNGYAKKEDISELLDKHKQELKTNDFLHIGEDLGEIKQMLKDSKEWQEKHTEEDNKRFELLFKKKRK